MHAGPPAEMDRHVASFDENARRARDPVPGGAARIAAAVQRMEKEGRVLRRSSGCRGREVRDPHRGRQPGVCIRDPRFAPRDGREDRTASIAQDPVRPRMPARRAHGADHRGGSRRRLGFGVLVVQGHRRTLLARPGSAARFACGPHPHCQGDAAGVGWNARGHQDDHVPRLADRRIPHPCRVERIPQTDQACNSHGARKPAPCRRGAWRGHRTAVRRPGTCPRAVVRA